MKKILSLMLGMTFVFGTLAFAQDASKDASASPDSGKSSGKHEKKSKKNKKSADKMDSTSTPKQ
jgi:hypothetical protein